MKKNNKLVTILLASSLLLPGIAPLATGVTSVSAATETVATAKQVDAQYVTVVDQVLRNVRSDQAVSNGFVPAGKTVTNVRDAGKGWFQVDYDGNTGYIQRSEVTSVENYENMGQGDIHNVSAPKDSERDAKYIVAVTTGLRTKDVDVYRPLRMLKSGEEVEYLGTTANGWFKVKDKNDVEGYVYAGDVTSVDNYNDTSTPELHDVNTTNESKREGKHRALLTTSIRTKDSRAYRVIAELKRDEVVTYLGTTDNDWFKVKTEDGKIGFVYRGDVTAVEEETEEGLVVESVSAINNDGVIVVIEAAAEDMDDVNVEVLDNEGNVVSTKAKVVAEGQTEVTFDFVTPFAADYEFEGVWSVNGAEYNFDAINQFDAIMEAVNATDLNEVKLLESLNNASIVNVNEDKLADYKTAILAAVADEEQDVEDLNDIQDIINKKNKELGETVDKKAAAKAVNEAENQIQLLNALTANFERVNKDWIVTYATNIEYPDGAASFDEIQETVDTINGGKILANNPTNAAEQAKHTALIEAWMKPDEEEETAKEEAIEASKLAEAAFKVLEANTPNRIYAALVDYANLLDDEDALDVEDIKEENKQYYFDLETKTTPEQIVTDGNAAAEAAADAIKDRITLTSVAISPQDLESKGYVGYSANFKYDPSEEIKEVKVELFKGKDLLATNTATTKLIDSMNEKTAESYVTSPFDIFDDHDYSASSEGYWINSGWAGDTFDTPTEVKVTIVYSDATSEKSRDGFTVDNNDAITLYLVNDAETAEDVKVALDGLAKTEYLNVTSADRIFIAEQVLETRDDQGDDKKYADFADVNTAIDNAITARTTAINAVNVLKLEGDDKSSLTKIANALLAVGHDSLTGEEGAPTANDTAIADAFITSLEFDEDGITPQFRSIAAIRAAIDAVL